jgi:hypothetical protein
MRRITIADAMSVFGEDVKELIKRCQVQTWLNKDGVEEMYERDLSVALLRWRSRPKP